MTERKQIKCDDEPRSKREVGTVVPVYFNTSYLPKEIWYIITDNIEHSYHFIKNV
jgi:hypothetical protein